MTEYKFPTAEEMAAIERRANQMRAQAMSNVLRTFGQAIAHTPAALGAMLRRAAHI